MKNRYSRRKSFTLVELLVIIAVISVLMALLLPTLRRAQETARATSCLNMLRQVNIASSSYADLFYGFVPSTQSSWVLVSGTSWGWKDYDWPTLYSNAGFPDALNGVLRCPKIKKGGWGYTYGIFVPYYAGTSSCKDAGYVSNTYPGDYKLSGHNLNRIASPSTFPLFADTAGGSLSAPYGISNGTASSAGMKFGPTAPVNRGGCQDSLWFAHEDFGNLSYADGHAVAGTVATLLNAGNYNPSSALQKHGISYYWAYGGYAVSLP